MLVVAKVVIQAASERKESRGVHLRTDFPDTDPQWRSQLTWRRGSAKPHQTFDGTVA